MSDSSAAATIVPQELLTDILLRLPAKSFGQFRCVSQPWRSLLSNLLFITTHLTLHLNDPENLILLCSSDHSPHTIALTGAGSDAVSRKLICPALQNNEWAKVEGSCHGLVLLIDEENRKFLMNPATLELAEVPNFSLALDRFISFSMSGFGYDAVHNDYKIVTLSYYDTDNEHEPDCDQTFVDVFSVKMKTWRRIENSPYDHAVPNVASGVFVNGCLHWLASSRTVGYLSVIAAFSLADEEFEEVPPPSSVDVEKFVFNELLVLGGCLAMVVDYFKGSIDVWVMKQYGVQDSWTKFTVNVAGDSMKPVCLLRDGEVVMEKDGEKLVKYDLAEGISRDMVVVDLADLFEEVVMTFTESLLSPNFDEE